MTHHAHDGPGDDVPDQGRVEWLRGQVLVVLLGDGLGRLVQLEPLELESLALKPADDLALRCIGGRRVRQRQGSHSVASIHSCSNFMASGDN